MVRLKRTKITTTAGETRFQFHYGSIKTLSVLRLSYISRNFNSTMVRLKLPPTNHKANKEKISIPLWFD